MNGDSRMRNSSLSSGFSFVELLVTILVAGLAFAALVPLFVQAQEQNSADNARNIALQVAQDKVEKVRQLDYDQITNENLESPTYAGGQFGPYWDFVRGGSTKRFTIQYQVEPYPSDAEAGAEQYKRVEVSVAWTGPPDPVKAAVIQTLVYRQYAGPELINYEVGPLSVFQDPADPSAVPDGNTIFSGPVVVDVTINPSDIESMNGSAADPADRGWVKFTVNSFTGVTVASEEVRDLYSGLPGRYQFQWDNSGALDGIYRIEVTAFSATGMQGASVSRAFNVELVVPPAPTGLTALSGDTLVSLSWDVSAIGDFSHYELWRGVASGAASLYQDDLSTPSFTDTAVDNGTTYYYQVRVVDTDGYASAFSEEVAVTPSIQADTLAPSVPTGLTATKLAGAGTINLAWDPSTDYGTPASGVLGYIVERSSSSAGPWTQLDGSYPNIVYPDSSAGWDSTWYYRVAAIDNVGNMSEFTPVAGPVKTDPQTKYALTVTNTNASDIYCWVQNVGTGKWYSTNGTESASKPAGTRVKKNKSEVWSNLPSGVYNVFASTSTSGTPALASKSGSGDLTGGPNGISF